MKLCLVILVLFSSILGMAQDQFTVRLNEQGLMKMLQLAVKYNTGTSGSKTLVIPSNLYKFIIKKDRLADNPIVQLVGQISDLDLNKDLPFYFHTSDIKLNGVVDQKSLTAQISNSSATGFDLKLSLKLRSVTINGSSISLCEDKLKNAKKCGHGLKTTVKSFKINTANRPVIISSKLRFSVKQNFASVKVVSVSSNLESASAPDLNLSFDSIDVPPITIVINGEETELDTSGLKDEILKHKEYLAKKLMSFAADFIASDLAEMINVYLKKAKAPTSVVIYRQEAPEVIFNEMEIQYEPAQRDNTYVHRPVYIPPKSSELSQKSPSKVMEEQILEIIRSALIELSFNNIKAPNDKDLQVAGVLSMILNGESIVVANRLGNKPVSSLPALNLSSHRAHDLNLAISEPVVNSGLDLVNRTGLFRELFDSLNSTPGLSLEGIQLHFAPAKTLKAIVRAQIDLSKTATDGFGDWIKKQWAMWRERDNNNGKIYFPLEITIVPTVVASPTGAALKLDVKSPFNGSQLLNTYAYPSNVSRMKSEVREGILDELKTGLGPHVNKSYTLDISKFLNQSGVVFRPKSISFEQGAYMLINLDISDIKFSSLNPNQK